MSTSFWDHSIATLEKALHLRKQIEALKANLASLMGGGSAVAKRRGRPPKKAIVESSPSKPDGRKGKRSAATIAKMKAAQKARWAKKGVTSAAVVSTKASGKTRKKRKPMSAEAREKIAAAQRARWAKRKSA